MPESKFLGILTSTTICLDANLLGDFCSIASILYVPFVGSYELR